MPSIATALREEVTRLARRETNIQTQGVRKASARCRKDIAALKRLVSELNRKMLHLERDAGRRTALQTVDAGPARIRFRADGLTSHRKALGFSAADYAKLVGVTGQTIYQWERGTSRPRPTQLSALASVRRLGKRAAQARLAELPSRPAGRTKKSR